MEVVFAVVTLATAVKDMVALAEKIHTSFEKVSDNLRNAQVLASEMKQTIDELKEFCEQHSATLENDNHLRDALLAVIAKLRQFDSEIVPLIAGPSPSPRLLSRVKGGFKAWRKGGHIEASIRQLKKDVKKCERNFVMMSVARMQVKLNALQGSSNEGLQVMKQVSDVLITHNTLSCAIQSSSSSSQRLTAASSNQTIVAFSQTSSSTSAPMLTAPSLMQEQIIRDAYLKWQVDVIADLLSDILTRGTTHSIEPLEAYEQAFNAVDSKWLIFGNPESLHRGVVMKALEIRETLEKLPMGASIQQGAWDIIILANGLGEMGMYEEGVKMGKWAVRLFRVLVNANKAIYSPYLVQSLRNLCLLNINTSNNDCTLSTIEEAVRISQDLQTPTAPAGIRVQYGSALSVYAVTMSGVKDHHKRAIELAGQSVKLMEDINGIDFLPSSYEQVDGIVQVSRHFLTRLYQVSPSNMAIIEYARALRALSNCLMADGQSQEALAAKLRALPIFYNLANDMDMDLAAILHELVSQKCKLLLPAENVLEYAEDCVTICRRHTELNPSKYGRFLCSALWQKANALNRLGRDSAALEVWKEIANIAQQTIQDQAYYADALYQLSWSFRRLKKHEEAVSSRTQSVLIYEAINNRTTASQANGYYDLCNLYQLASRFPEAVEAGKKAIKQYRVLNFVEPDKWTCKIGWAVAKLVDSLFSAGDHEAALNEGHESMQIFESHIKTNPKCVKCYIYSLQVNMRVSTTVNNERVAIERMDDVLRQMRRLVVDFPEETSPGVLEVELYYGYNLYRLDHLQEARKYMDELIENWEAEEHPHVDKEILAHSHSNALSLYASILDNQGHTDLALVPIQRGTDICKPFSTTSPKMAGQTAWVMCRHARLLMKLGQYEEASVMAEGTLKFIRETKTNNLSYLVSTLHVVGVASDHMHARDRVVDVSQEAVDICNSADFVQYCQRNERSFCLLSYSLRLLSSGYANSGNHELGLQYGQEAVDAAKALCAQPRIPSAEAEQYHMEANSHLGAMYLDNNRIDEACRIFEGTRAYYTEKVKVHPGQSVYLISMLHHLGIIYCSERMHDEGRAVAQEAKNFLDHLAKVLPELHKQVHIAMCHELTTPSLQVLNRMKEKLSCTHQVTLSF